MDNPKLKGNEAIEKAVARASGGWTADNVRSLVKSIQRQMNAGAHFLIPIDYADPENPDHYRLFSITRDDETYLACFTNEEELRKGLECGILSNFIDAAIELAIDQDNLSGIMINPFGTTCCLPKKFLWMIYDGRKPREDDWIRENYLLEKAIRFATTHHAGQVRKGTHIPYIVHPLETMNILRSMNADNNLLIAGVLHDTIEDTTATSDDILDRFGLEVASLVDGHSEDKSKTWDERKTHAIDELARSGKRFKMLVMADKVSNLRSIAADHRALGDKLWERFNAPAEKQAWYYSGIQDALWDMQLDPDTAPIYWEMVGLYKDVFVKFYHVREYCPPGYEEEYLLQICKDGTAFRLDKGKPEWIPIQYQDGLIEEDEILLSRPDAERLEDEWNKPFWECVEQDLYANTYEIINNKDRSARIEILNRALTLSGEDSGPACKTINGKDEYEYQVSLDEDNSTRLIVQLRMKYGITSVLESVFIEAFGRKNPSSRLMDFCKEKQIVFSFSSY